MKRVSQLIVAGALIGSFLSVQPVLAATTVTSKTVTQQTATQAGNVQMTTETTVKYELPYPGILPDNPLYFLKQIRDWIMERLITDPLKKIEFYMKKQSV